MSTELSDEQLKELEAMLPLRICIVGDTVDKERHRMIHAFPDLLSTIQSLRNELAAAKERIWDLETAMENVRNMCFDAENRLWPHKAAVKAIHETCDEALPQPPTKGEES